MWLTIILAVVVVIFILLFVVASRGVTISRQIGPDEGIDDAEIVKAYDRISHWPQFRVIRRVIIHELKRHHPQGTLVDVGCDPGYLLVEMELNDKSWYLIKKTAGVTGFVGSKTKPVPLSEDEVAEIMDQTKETKAKPVPKVMFAAGEVVRVKEGPFKNFSGTIEETNLEKGKIKVMISIFGRATPVDLETWQVEKM